MKGLGPMKPFSTESVTARFRWSKQQHASMCVLVYTISIGVFLVRREDRQPVLTRYVAVPELELHKPYGRTKLAKQLRLAKRNSWIMYRNRMENRAERRAQVSQQGNQP
jgi:hypothetical protein